MNTPGERQARESMACRSCGQHDRASEGYPCTGCGTFICLTCTFRGITLCAACAAKTGKPRPRPEDTA